MDAYTRTVVNLKVLSRVCEHDKIFVEGGVFSIQRVSSSRLGSIWNWFTRSMTNQSRSHTLAHLNHLYTDCERLADATIRAEIPRAIRGIESLRRTYDGDIATIATLEFVSSRLCALTQDVSSDSSVSAHGSRGI